MSDGKIVIDLDLNNLAKGSLNEFVNDAENKGNAAYKKISDPFEKAIVATLDTDAKTAGIKNFGALLAELPESKRTKLLSEARDNEAKNFKWILDEIPKEKLTEVIGKAKDVELKTFKKQIDDLPDEEQTELVAKYEKAQFNAYQQLLEQVPEEKRTELEAKAEKTGVINFQELLEAIPEDKRTALTAEAHKLQAIEFEKLLDDIPDEQKTDLVSRAHTAQTKVFDEAIKAVPKEKRTTLESDIKDAKAKQYQSLLSKMPTSVVTRMDLNDGASPKLKGLQREAEETSSRFKSLGSIIKGSFAGNLLATGVSKAIGVVNSSIGESVKRLDTLNNATRAYGNMGIKASDAKKANKDLQKAIDGLPTSLQDATKSQQLLTTSMDNDVGRATDVYKALNDGILGLGGSSEQVSEAVLQLSQSFSNGKVDGQTWNSMMNAQMGPTLNAIAKKMHMTTGELKDGLSEGKISVKDFQDQLIEMDKKGGGGLASLEKTAKDSTKGLGTAFQNMRTKIIASTASVLDGFQKAGLSDYINSFNKTLADSGPAFKAFGETAGKILPPVVGTIADLAKIGGNLIAGMVEPFIDLSKAIGKVAGHNKSLQGLGGGLGNIAKHGTAIKVLGGAIGGLVAVLGAYKLMMLGVSAVTKTWAAAQRLLNWALKDNPIGALITILVAVGFAFYELYKHNKKFRKFVDGLIDGAKNAFEGIAKWFGKAGKVIGKFVSGVVDFFKKDWKEIGLLILNPISGAFALLYKHNDKFKKFIDGIIKSVKEGFNGLGKWFDKQFSGFGKWFKKLEKDFKKGWDSFIKFTKTLLKGFGKAVIVAIAIPVGIAMTIFEPIIKAVKSFVKEATKLLQSWGKEINKLWSKIWDPIVKFTSNVFKSITKTLGKFFSWAVKEMNSFGKSVSKAWHKVWDPIADFLNDVIKGIKKSLDKFFTWIGHAMSSFSKSINKIWHNVWNPIKNFFESTTKSIKKIASSAWDWMVDRIQAFGKAVTKIWRKLWNGVSDFFSDIWNSIEKIGSKAWNWIEDKISDFGDNVSKTWHNTWNGLKDFFGDIWNGIKDLAKDGMNGVIGIVNKGIGGINGMIHSFGGDKETIKPMSKFATGTNNWRDVMGTPGAGAPPGLAMVNDGNGAEAIVYPNGQVAVPSGRNVVMPMMGGETVIPHEQAAQAGLVQPNAYKNGIGNIMGAIGKTLNSGAAWAGKAFNGGKSFVADIIDDVKDMVKDFTGGLKTAWTFVQDPKKAFSNMVAPVTGGASNFAESSVKMGRKQIDNFGGAWMGEVAKAVKDVFSNSGSGGKGGMGDDYQFKSKAKDSGADPWAYFFRECVSFVASRLDNVGNSPKTFSHLGNGSDWVNAKVPHHSTPRPGDVSVYGPGSRFGNHVAIVTDVKGGKYKEEGYNFNSNGKYYGPNKFGWMSNSDATTFLRYPRSGIRGASSEDKEEPKSDLQGFVSKQIKPAIDNLTEMFSAVTSKYEDSDALQAVANGKGAMSKSSFNSTAKKAAGMIGEKLTGHDLSVLYQQAMTESNVNPSINTGYNDHDGTGTPKGLFQYKNATFASYAYKSHRNILSALDQFLAVFNNSNWRRDFPPLGVKRGWGPSGAKRFANGGWGDPDKTNIFNEVRGEPEVAINPKRESADYLLFEAAQKTAEVQPNSLMAKVMANAQNAKKSLQKGHNVNQPLANKNVNVANLQQSALNDNGDLIVEVNLDGEQIGKHVEPVVSAVQQNKIQIQTNAMGLGGGM